MRLMMCSLVMASLMLTACSAKAVKRGDVYQWNGGNEYSCSVDELGGLKEEDPGFGDCNDLINRNHHSN